MKNKHVIALLAAACLIVSVSVTSMADDTLSVSFQTAISDSEGREQNSEDTANTESVSKSLSGSDTNAVISDMDSKVSHNPCTAPDTDVGTPDLPYATPDMNSEPSEPLGSEILSPYAGEEDFILSGTTLTSSSGVRLSFFSGYNSKAKKSDKEKCFFWQRYSIRSKTKSSIMAITHSS